jgi:hypothetical protein
VYVRERELPGGQRQNDEDGNDAKAANNACWTPRILHIADILVTSVRRGAIEGAVVCRCNIAFIRRFFSLPLREPGFAVLQNLYLGKLF